MAKIMTVLGAIDSSALGHCQMHEHIFVHATPASEKAPALKIDDENLSLRELKSYRAAGGAAILDAQPLAAGRDASVLAKLSKNSGVHIITTTGYHLPNFYPADHWVHTGSFETLRDRFLKELLEGCEEVKDVRPGAVKAAISNDGPSGRFETLLRAAASAAARANVPLIMHTEKGAGAVEAVKLCEGEGMNPARIAVCHADRQADDYKPHDEIAATGVFMEYDTIARYKYHDDESERRLILHMMEKGFADRLLISLDTTAARLRSYGSDIGLDFILKNFIPSLFEDGLTRAEIENITRNNPVRIFE